MRMILTYMNPRRAGWPHTSRLSVVGAPLLGVAALHSSGEIANSTGLVNGWYISPYVALVAVLANRICIRAALIAVVLVIPSYNWLYMSARHSFDPLISVEVIAYLAMLVVAFLTAPRASGAAPPPPCLRCG